jgi:RNA polymerase sigma factor for flagellar operon FliA
MAGNAFDSSRGDLTGGDYQGRLVDEHLPLVGYLVAEVATKLPPHVNRDDLTSAAMMALVQAARTFDPERGVPFPMFAKSRLRGAIIDELRQHDWISRAVRTKARQRAQAEDELAALLGRHPTTRELAEHLSMPIDELNGIDADVHRSVVLSLQGFSDAGTLEGMLPSPDPDPEGVLLRRERLAYLLAAVGALPERLRVVVQGYFLEERPMVELAAELQVSESRISQMRAEALAMLKDGITAMLAPEELEEPARSDGCVARRRASYYAAIAAGSDFRGRISASVARPLRSIEVA